MNQYDQYENEQNKNGAVENPSSSKGSWLLPISIVIAGIMIAGAVVYSVGRNSLEKQSGAITASRPQEQPPVFGGGGPENMKPINDKDHILGNPEAPVKVVEFADTECPFCKRFHPTMHQLIQEYGRSGQVAWIYRHFPLDQIHPKARKEAAALECANELGGSRKFWEYTDRLYEITPSNNNLDLDELPRIAEYVGLDLTKFNACLNSGKYDQHIQEDLDDAIRSGGTGTPYTIVIAPDGQKFPISGAQPYSAVKQVVDTALRLK